MAVAQRQVCTAVAQRQECMVITQRLAYMIYLHGNLCRNEDKDMSTKGKILDYVNLIQKADEAMYQAKEAGKNTFYIIEL